MKETAGKIISQKGGWLNFIVQLMKVGLLLMKNVLMLLAKISNKEMKDIMKIVKSLEDKKFVDKRCQRND